MGREIPIADPIGDEIRRWRVMWTAKRLRLLCCEGEWRVMYTDTAMPALLCAYDSRDHAEDVCQRIMALDSGDWFEMPLPKQWWA